MGLGKQKNSIGGVWIFSGTAHCKEELDINLSQLRLQGVFVWLSF